MHQSSILPGVQAAQDGASVAWLRRGNSPLAALLASLILIGGASLTLAPPTGPSGIGVQAVVLVSLYALVALVVNRARVRRVDGGLELSHGPLPMLPGRTVRRPADARLIVARDAYTDGRDTLLGRLGSPYALELGFADGRRRRLIANLDREQAMRLRSAVDRR